MLKSFKYRIYPDEFQKELLTNIFGQVRFVYNYGLEMKISAYAKDKTNIDCFDIIKKIKILKDGEYNWLSLSPSQALQMTIRNLDNAYTNFFKGSGFPKFKNKHGKQTFQLPQGVRLSENNKQIFIPKLKYIDIDLHREFKGEIKTVTISKSTTNKYYISVLVETNIEKPIKKEIIETTSVGVDLGIKDFAITSDGKKFENKDFLKSTLKKLKVEQRSLSKKKKGSNHYLKQKMVVSLLHEHIRNQRIDYLHKISKYLVDNYDTICIEDLNVKGMSATCKPKQDENGKYIPNGQSAKSGLNKAILDMGWNEFKIMLEYKCDWYGKNLSIIGRFDPSSKTCSDCGYINKDLTLKDREWMCPKCGSLLDRDVNAAKNIKIFGLRNKPSITQSKSIDYACNVETTESLV
jgi:putative transposase